MLEVKDLSGGGGSVQERLKPPPFCPPLQISTSEETTVVVDLVTRDMNPTLRRSNSDGDIAPVRQWPKSSHSQTQTPTLTPESVMFYTAEPIAFLPKVHPPGVECGGLR